jgi:serine phosphatase RsbU (regulator of sigma subunit)
MPETEARLEPGDILLLYTDGVVEATNRQREQFGVDRLARALEEVSDEPVERIVEHLFERSGAWMDQQRDDVTIVVARQVGAPG